MSKHERSNVDEDGEISIKRVKTEAVVKKGGKENQTAGVQTSTIATPLLESEAAQPAKVQEEDLAVTVRGHSFIHGIENRQQHATIFAKAYRELSYMQQVKRNPNINHQLWKEAFTWTTSYLGTGEPDERYLVVGLVLHDQKSPSKWLTPPEDSDAINRSVSEPTRQDNTGCSIYLAVTTIIPLTRPNNDFFALMPSKSGRGRPHIVPRDHIFFFNEYRSNYQTAKARRREWKAAVVYAWKRVVGECDSAAAPELKGTEDAVARENNTTDADVQQGVFLKVRAWLGVM